MPSNLYTSLSGEAGDSGLANKIKDSYVIVIILMQWSFWYIFWKFKSSDYLIQSDYMKCYWSGVLVVFGSKSPSSPPPAIIMIKTYFNEPIRQLTNKQSSHHEYGHSALDIQEQGKHQVAHDSSEPGRHKGYSHCSGPQMGWENLNTWKIFVHGGFTLSLVHLGSPDCWNPWLRQHQRCKREQGSWLCCQQCRWGKQCLQRGS